MRLIALSLLFFAFHVFSQVHQVEVTGPASESIAISDAEKIVLKQLLTTKGVNGEEYLKKLTEKFFSRYDNFKERRLRQTYGQNYQSSMTPEQKETLEARFDRETADYYKRFLGLDLLFNSLIKEKLPENKWKVDVTQKAGAFESWFNRFESAQAKVKFLIIPHIELINMDWTELHVSGERPFLMALWTAWEKWAQDESPSTQISLCLDQCKRQWIDDKSTENNELGVYFGQEDEILLVVDLRLELRKLRTLPNGEVELQHNGTYSLHDYSSRSLLEAMNLGPETRRVNFKQEPQIVNSTLANHFFRLSLPAFTRLKSFNDFRPYNQVLQLVIEGQKNLLEVKDLEQQLKLITGTFSPRWELYSLTRNTVSFRILYRGEEKSFKELITNLQQLKSSYNAQCVWDTNSKDLKLQLIHE